MNTGSRHLAATARAVGDFDVHLPLLQRWGDHLAERLLAGSRLMAAGNGGSAAQAQHLTAELVGRYRDERRPLSAICLTAETSSLTALVNDYPATELYARQVEAHGRPRDVLVLLSTSGRSPNVVEAARRGRRVGCSIWALTGPTPNPLADAADETLAIDAPTAATVQELHLVAVHILCASVDARIASGPITDGRVQAVGGPHGLAVAG